MTPAGIIAALGIYGGALAVGAISSIVPFVSIEVFLVTLTSANGASLPTAIAIVLLAAGGQLAGKLPMFDAEGAPIGLLVAGGVGLHAFDTDEGPGRDRTSMEEWLSLSHWSDTSLR